MRIAQIEIENFRGIRKGRVTLPKHGVLFGPNNVGKSTVTEALALLFGRERMAYALSDWDFYGGTPQADSRFTLVATITDFGVDDNEEPSQFPQWFMGDSARPVWWHDATKTVTLEGHQPPGTRLAAQIALSARYNEENCEFELIRFFYDGPCDPFTDDHRTVPPSRLHEIGVFLLPGNRQWDKLLAFGSSSFLKVLRQHGALPGAMLTALKTELRAPNSKIEDAPELQTLLVAAEAELRSFLMLGSTGRLVYRPTSLDSLAVLQSLVPHIQASDGSDLILPLARHGSGTLSLQAFLIVLAFAEQRRIAGKNFILIAEEPELHLHPSLHRRLANRIRSLSIQSIVTTHSPVVAGTYQPTEAVYVHNSNGQLDAKLLREKPISQIGKNRIENLYLRYREELYEALMGGPVVVPEGLFDYEWLHLWQRVAGGSADLAQQFQLSPLSIIPTSDSAVADTFKEIIQFKTDVVPLVDGDDDGDKYVQQLLALPTPPRRIVRLGTDAGMEYLSAWILEPCLSNPGAVLASLLPSGKRTLKSLQEALTSSVNKKNPELHEHLAWEAISSIPAMQRAGEFLDDLAAITAGKPPKNTGWQLVVDSAGSEIFTATHIHKTS